MSKRVYLSLLLAASVSGIGMVARAGDEAGEQKKPWYDADYDKNGDGVLSQDEKETARKEWQKQRNEWAMKNFDKDGDGQLSPEEKDQVRQARKAYREESLKTYDKDGDGKLSAEEKEAAKKDWKARKAEGQQSESGEPESGGDAGDANATPQATAP